MSICAEDIVARLSEVLSEELRHEILPTENAEGGYDIEIEKGGLVLTVSVTDEEIVIHSIFAERTPKGTGIGVVTAVHACADEYGIPVIARKVVPTAVTFWGRLGYELSTESEDYIRSPA